MVVTVQLLLERRDDGLLTRHTRRSLWLSGSVRCLDTTGLEAGSLWQCEGHSGRVQSRALGLAADTTRVLCCSSKFTGGERFFWKQGPSGVSEGKTLWVFSTDGAGGF